MFLTAVGGLGGAKECSHNANQRRSSRARSEQMKIKSSRMRPRSCVPAVQNERATSDN